MNYAKVFSQVLFFLCLSHFSFSMESAKEEIPYGVLEEGGEPSVKQELAPDLMKLSNCDKITVAGICAGTCVLVCGAGFYLLVSVYPQILTLNS